MGEKGEGTPCSIVRRNDDCGDAADGLLSERTGIEDGGALSQLIHAGTRLFLAHSRCGNVHPDARRLR